MLKVLVVAGARPNFIKIAPIYHELIRRGHTARLVHTGQHYDASLSHTFFADLKLPKPAHALEVGSGSHAEQTARVMERFDPVLLAEDPDWVVVVGDVNSTLAAALVTAKRRSESGVRIAHVEAGLRSGDWAMPEEVNRVLTDRLSDLLLTHSPESAGHLAREGIESERAVFVGNVMMDSLFAVNDQARDDQPGPWGTLPPRGYGVVTLHRPSNVDTPALLTALVAGLGSHAEHLPLVWPIHPRTRKSMERFGIAIPTGITMAEPQGYRAMVKLVGGAAVVITDSGGLQEETTAIGIPCVTVRESTERPVTVEVGTNRLVPWPPTSHGLRSAVLEAIEQGPTGGSRESGLPEGWDGRAAFRIVDALERAGKR